jgi:hypothetical protein
MDAPVEPPIIAIKKTGSAQAIFSTLQNKDTSFCCESYRFRLKASDLHEYHSSVNPKIIA